jgi:hypothetical protein
LLLVVKAKEKGTCEVEGWANGGSIEDTRLKEDNFREGEYDVVQVEGGMSLFIVVPQLPDRENIKETSVDRL